MEESRPARNARNARSAPKHRRSRPKRKPQRSRGQGNGGQPQSQALKPEPAELPVPQGAFAALIPELQRAIAAEGYSTPTPIQEQCIAQLLEGRDMLGSAQTGTGKTAAFTLPLLQRLSDKRQRPKKGTPRALILAPTRELAAQIDESIRTYGRFLPISHTVVFGGVNQHRQVKALQRGVDVLVATPGRLLDLMEQGYIHLEEVEVFILDEVDRMLDMGFVPDIKRVLKRVPENRQTLFFSATMPPKIAALAQSMVRNPARVSITPEKPTVDRIAQRVMFVSKQNKPALLASVLQDQGIRKAIVFTQMKHAANKVVDKLEAAGVRATAIHGNKSQAARTRALAGFKRHTFRVLVATDVAARGLDVDDITHVINYDLPMEAETYVHRIGRTGRAGADGAAISFCSAEDRAYLRAVETLLGQKVPTDTEHEFHCDAAQRSTAPAPKNFGRNGGGGSQRNANQRRNSRGRQRSGARGGRQGGRRQGGRPQGSGGGRRGQNSRGRQG
jgi:ATP-dependent RNA helicase RhlE